VEVVPDETRSLGRLDEFLPRRDRSRVAALERLPIRTSSQVISFPTHDALPSRSTNGRTRHRPYFLANFTMTNSTPESTGTTASAPTKAPLATFRYGHVSVAVFRDNPTIPLATRVSIRASYKDENGIWQRVSTLSIDDLLPAAFALSNCYEYLSTLAKDRAE
jgi:hypothetical protein